MKQKVSSLRPSPPWKIAVFFTHPTQHHAPWFRALAAREDVQLKVFFLSRAGAEMALDKEFGTAIRWDVPLRDGYEHEWLPGVPLLPDSYLGVWRINRGVYSALTSTPWDAVFNPSYSQVVNWLIWYYCRRLGIPQICHSDATNLIPRAFWRKMIKGLPVRGFYRGVPIVLASGDHNRDYLHHYGVPDSRITPCPIPVDIARFRRCREAKDWNQRVQAVRQQYRIASHEKVAVFCGKLSDRKRPLDLARAAVRLEHRPLKAFFIGTGQLADAVKAVDHHRIIVTGFVNQSEIPYYLGVGDVLVMPSSFDPHPIVVTEAASLGIPALVTNQVGCWGPTDVLRPGENGAVYPCGDVNALAEVMDRLLFQDEAVRRRMSLRAVELAATQDVAVAAAAVVEAIRTYYEQPR